MVYQITKIVSAFSVPLAVIIIIAFGAAKKIPVYDAFVEGAKGGVKNTFSVIPPLVGLMVGIYALRASGAVDLAANVLSPLLSFLKMPPEVLPLAILRPISGSGSLAVVSDIFKNFRLRFIYRPLCLGYDGFNRNHFLHPCGLFRFR